MFIPSIDAIWCECLTFFHKIGFSSFSTRSIVHGLKFKRNECHFFNRVIRQDEMCRYCCCSVSMTRVICGLSVFGESFAKCTSSLPYVLFLTFVTFYHVRQVCGFASYMLLDFPYLSRVAECARCSTIFYVGAGETSVFGVAAESAMWLVGCSVCWIPEFCAN